jgi:phenylacetate-CoA ligase
MINIKFLPYIFKFFSSIRNPTLWKIFQYKKKMESNTFTDITLYQFNKLHNLLIHAYENTIFWNKRFNDSNFDPYAFNSFDDLKKIPPICKNDLIQYNNEIQIKNIKFNKIFNSNTSGTTGVRLNFPKNEYWDSSNRASIFQGYSWYNVKPWDFKIYFWGINHSFLYKIKMRLLDFLVRRYRIFSIDDLSFSKVSRYNKKAIVIEGYSSIINEFAKYVIKNNINFPFLKLIKATSETISEDLKNNVLKAFNLNVCSEYGSAEAGIIAFSCPNGNMHINIDDVYIESLNDEIILTNLNSYSFPIIRYKQGDYIDYDNNHFCNCGLKTPLLNNVIGRSGALIFGFNDKYPSLLLYNIFKNINLKFNFSFSYNAVQYKLGHLTIFITFSIQPSIILFENIIKNEFSKYTSDNDLIISIKYITKKNYNKKYKKNLDFESYL